MRKRFKLRLYRLFNRIDGKKPELTEIQRKSTSILRKMVINKSSTLLIDPITSNCYVEYGHYFIKLNSTSILIRNTNFTNYCEFDYKVGEKMVSFFYRNVNIRRVEMESVYEENMIRLLDKISKEI